MRKSGSNGINKISTNGIRLSIVTGLGFAIQKIWKIGGVRNYFGLSLEVFSGVTAWLGCNRYLVR